MWTVYLLLLPRQVIFLPPPVISRSPSPLPTIRLHLRAEMQTELCEVVFDFGDCCRSETRPAPKLAVRFLRKFLDCSLCAELGKQQFRDPYRKLDVAQLHRESRRKVRHELELQMQVLLNPAPILLDVRKATDAAHSSFGEPRPSAQLGERAILAVFAHQVVANNLRNAPVTGQIPDLRVLIHLDLLSARMRKATLPRFSAC